MDGALERMEMEPAQRRRDTELTLGPFVLLGLVIGLAVVCGLFFGLGYAVGKLSSHEPLAASQQPQAVDLKKAVQAAASRLKPSATAQPVSASQRAAANSQGAATSAGTPSSAEGWKATAANGVSSAKQALQPAAQQPGQQAVRPALPQNGSGTGGDSRGQDSGDRAGGLMVQVAAVAHREDADVLVSALRKRGYSVTVSRDPSSGALLVRVGPFSSRRDAEDKREHLLSDGYNAVVEP
jgi:DedD protein